MDNFTAAIATAQAFYDEGDADQSMVNSARITLVAAMNVFNGQKQLGTKESAIDPNNDVYVFGSFYSGMTMTPAYWVNGEMVTLESTGWVMIRDTIVSGSDVYVLGNDCYWKNGTVIELSNDASTSSIVVVAR